MSAEHGADGFVRNRAQLLEGGDRAGRRVVLDVLEDALAALAPETLLGDVLSLEDDRLTVDGVAYDLAGFEERYLLAVGKGSASFAAAAEELLGDRLTGGLVVDERVTVEIDGIETREADHPIPTAASERAGDAALSLADRAGPEDLVIAVVTGGASALLSAPPEGVTVAEQAAITDALLRAGAPIEDLNAVRKHLSRIKGGRLTERLRPATVTDLVVIDEAAGVPWGPTVPDATTAADAVSALRRHGCWADAPEAIREHLRRAGEGTPSSFADPPHTVVLADGPDACRAAAESARSRGIDAAVLSTSIEGESRTVAATLSSVAAEIAETGRPFEPPCVLVSGGETTVTVGSESDPGTGGPNQEFALGCAARIAGTDSTVLAVDTDGTDGPTDRAGGIVDGHTLRRAADSGVDVDAALRAHDATGALADLGDDVLARPGTNVNDLRLIYVAERSDPADG
ncbi:glycerate kinase type-2 family protein [Natronomonas sp.]|uniref:glycerate kinase type-2 family protein n=1 Tax=Natronomonas sp. TaxID=2184060 RepID=UPI002635BBE3|nr:DUF4147 domain-containing protein [Natronomonas sp.]